MKLGRRTFLKFVGVGTIAGKLDFRSQRAPTFTEIVDNSERWSGANVYVKCIKPQRAGIVELYLGHGEARMEDVLENGLLLGALMCKPGIEEQVALFGTTRALSPLPSTYRLVARSRSAVDPNQPIGGELSIDYVPYRVVVTSGAWSVGYDFSASRRRRITGG